METEKNVATIEIIAKPCKTADGRTFTAYKAVQKNGKTIDCKFRRACGSIPEEDFFIDVGYTNMNVSINTKYPVLWIAKIDKIALKSEKLDGALAHGNIKILKEMF